MLPVETVLAVFPSSAVVCKVGLFKTLRLLPMTLAHAVALEVFGCDLNSDLDEPHALIAAWVLSQTPGELKEIISGQIRMTRGLVRFVKGLEKHVVKVRDAVNSHIRTAFFTYVPGKKQNDGTQLYSSGQKGFGWPLEVAECLCGAYGWDFDYTMSVPMTRALALLTVYRNRNGGENGGPDYYERIDIANLKKIGAIKKG